MKQSEKNIDVSCMHCIFIRRLITCKNNGRECSICKKPCCCRKCSPDVTGSYLSYEERRFFCAGIPIMEYRKKTNKSEDDMAVDLAQDQERLEEKSIIDDQNRNLITASQISTEEGKDGQLQFLW